MDPSKDNCQHLHCCHDNRNYTLTFCEPDAQYGPAVFLLKTNQLILLLTEELLEVPPMEKLMGL